MEKIPSFQTADLRTTTYVRLRYIRDRSKYTPHQGKREIARRDRQIANGRLATN